MDNSNNFGRTILKLTLFTSVIIWSCVFYDGFYFDMIGYMILLMIPIAIFWLMILAITIMPFFWFQKEKDDKSIIFKLYFPFYSVVTFLFFLLIIASFDFDKMAIVFFTPLFFGLMQSWVWLCKPKKKEIGKIKTEEEKVS